MDFFAKKFLDQHVIGNVLVENIKKLDIEELSAIAVVLKSLAVEFGEKEWGTLL